jgi:hypothetical protein
MRNINRAFWHTELSHKITPFLEVFPNQIFQTDIDGDWRQDVLVVYLLVPKIVLPKESPRSFQLTLQKLCVQLSLSLTASTAVVSTACPITPHGPNGSLCPRLSYTQLIAGFYHRRLHKSRQVIHHKSQKFANNPLSFNNAFRRILLINAINSPVDSSHIGPPSARDHCVSQPTESSISNT